MRAGRAKGFCGIAMLALVMGAMLARAQAQEQSSEGAARNEHVESVVVGTRIVTAGGRVLSESPTGISIETGKPLDREQVAASIRALFKSGVYSDVKAVAAVDGAGVRVDFVVTENFYFNQIFI